MNQNTIVTAVIGGIRLSVVAALLALLAGLLAITQPARAATYEVTNTANSGTGSLRWAIDEANSNPGPDTITFASATDENAILLAGTPGEDANAGGDLDILDGGDLTIQGNGAAKTIIDGAESDRVFHICPGGGCTNAITLSGVTIRSGNSGSDSGGGIFIEAGTTTVDGSTISNNTATDYGGGIYNLAGTVTVDGSTVSGNTANFGGGIYNLGTLNVQNGSTIRGNSANYGGGICNWQDGTTVVDGSTVGENTAKNDGGGIVNYVATLTIRSGSTIGGKDAGNTGNYGGGIINVNGTMTVDNSTISHNVAKSQGGGIHSQYATLNVQNGSTISDNTAGDRGGGIFNDLVCTTTVDGSSISDNESANGGGLFNRSTLMVQNGSTIGGNTASKDGGGIYNESGTMKVDGSSVSANEAGSGGGIYIEEGMVTLDGSSVSANRADSIAGGGGGIYNKATLNVQKGSIIGASNWAVSGGGIHNTEGGETMVDGSEVSDNTAVMWGGGIFNLGTLNVQNGSTVSGNTTRDGGGGILNRPGGKTTVDDSVIHDNKATSPTGYDNDCNGGGIFNSGTLEVRNGSTISANTAEDGGGGIHNAEGGETMVDGSNVSANTTERKGGGIYNRGTLNVVNGSIIGGDGAGNTSGWGGSGVLVLGSGGGIYNDESGETTVDGSTVSHNTATIGGGGGIHNEGGTLNVQNRSTISANTADFHGGGISNYEGGETTVDGSTISNNKASGLSGGGIDNNVGTLNVQNGSIVIDNTAGQTGGGIINTGTTTIDGSTVSANEAKSGAGIYNFRSGTLTVQNRSTISENKALESEGGGIFNTGTTTVDGSRILHNTATTNGGGVYNDADTAGATSVTGSCIVGNSAKSFFNNKPAQQIATGNWWGAAAGPNTPGADTTGGNVDVSGHLTTPILGCAPDLQVDKANDTGGNGTVGMPFHWTLTVRNSGITSATFNVSQRILKDVLPAGPTYGKPVAGSFVGVANSDNIQCTLSGRTLTCTAVDGDVILEPLTGRFEVTFSVTPGAPATLTNPAGICRVDPGGNVSESDESNNDCPVNVVVIGVSTRYLYLPVVLKKT